jgi:hypothetical protein
LRLWSQVKTKQLYLRYYGTVIDIVLKLITAVPDCPWRVNRVETELLLLGMPVVPPHEISAPPSTTMSAKAASPRMAHAGRSPLRR